MEIKVEHYTTISILGAQHTLSQSQFSEFLDSMEKFVLRERGVDSAFVLQMDHGTKEFDHVADEPDQLVELDQDGINLDHREYLLTKSAHKAIQAEAQQGRVIESELEKEELPVRSPSKELAAIGLVDGAQMADVINGIRIVDGVAIDFDAIKKKFEQLPDKKAKKKAAGEKVPAEKKGYAGKDLTKYVRMHEAGDPMDAIKNVMLKDGFCPQSTLSYYIKKILAKSSKVTVIQREDITDDERIERLKAENKAKTKERQKP